MIHRYIIEATDEVKGFEEAIDQLDREWGMEELEPCEDAISRQAVINVIDQWVKDKHILVTLPVNEVTPLFEGVHDLPPVNPQPKTGHWIRHDNGKYHWYLCSCCDAMAGSDEQMMAYRYCPNCGAKMESEE